MMKKSYQQPCTVFLILSDEEYRQNILCAGNSGVADEEPVYGLDPENNRLPLIWN